MIGQITYGALTSYLTPTSGFVEARDSFVLAAEDLNLSDLTRNAVVGAVKSAWATVGFPYLNNENDIVSFSVAGMEGKPVINSLAHTVTFKVAYGFSLDGLMPNIAVSPGAMISPGNDMAHNFATAVTYTVTSGGSPGQTQTWTIRGEMIDPEASKEIIDFYTDLQTGSSIIDSIQHTVKLYVEAGDNVTSLQPSLELSKGATVVPASGTTVDLSSPVIYTVTAQNGTTKQWTVTAIKDSISPKLLGAVAVSDSQVALVFDKNMSLDSLSNQANYTISSILSNNYDPQVIRVEVDCNNLNIVYLSTYGFASSNGYKVTVSNLNSSSGNAVRPDWTTAHFLTDDTSPPVLNTARVDGRKLSLTFNEYVQGASAINKNTFSVKANGTVVPVVNISKVGRRIILTLQSAAAVGTVVKVNYQQTNSSMVTDLSGNPLYMGEVTAINRTVMPTPIASIGSFYMSGFTQKQMIKHPTEPIIYVIFHSSRTVVSANLDTGVTESIVLNRQPERLYYSEGKLYVSLIDQPHSYYWWEEDQTGSIAILDGDTLQIDKQFNVHTDPFDMVVDNGIIFVTSGSGQWTHLSSYSSSTGAVIAKKTVRQQSYIQISEATNRLYTMDTDSSPRDISSYSFTDTGMFTDEFHYGKGSPYHGEYEMALPFRISTNKTHLFTGAGTIFNATELPSTDMVYSQSIQPFDDIAFSNHSQNFYTLDGQTLRQYNNETFALEKQIALPYPALAIFPGQQADQVLVAFYDNSGVTIMPYSLIQNAQTSPRTLVGSSVTASLSNVCTPPDSSNGGSTNPPAGGGGGGGGGGSFIPPIIAFIPPPIIAFIPVTPKPELAMSMTTTDMNVTTETSSDGVITSLEPDPVKLLEALQKAKEASEQQTARGGEKVTPKIILPAGTLGKQINVELPASIFINTRSLDTSTVIAVQSDSASYELPLRLLSPGMLKQLWGNNTNLAQLQVNITMEKTNDAIRQQIQSQMSADGFKGLTDSINFTITVKSGATSKEVTDFNSIYVTRSFILPAGANNSQFTALIYDPDTRQTSFVPATIRVENGISIIDVKVPHNSIYTIATSSKKFKDLSSHAARKDIEFMASKKVVVGVNASEFKPDLSVTRAEFSALLVRSLGLATSNSNVTRFNDVNMSSWYAGSVVAAAKAGLISGYADGSFRPMGIISRQEMAVMISKAMKYAGGRNQLHTDLASLKDVSDIAGWASSDVEHMLASGIMEVATDNSYLPNIRVTRADAAVALKRMLVELNFMNS